MLTKAYGESSMSKTRVYEWYKRFQDGREDVEDDECPGRPNTSRTDEKVKEMVMNDRQITIREAKFVPKLLNFEQKQRRMEVAQKPLNEVNGDEELLKRIITGDETWVCGYDVETNLIQIL